jgi:hypothetical protein
MKRILFFFALVCLLALCVPVVAYAADVNFTDIKGHWAEEAILIWAGEGVVQGSGGKFRPDDSVTRAELTVLLNRLLKYPDLTDNPFSDIKESDWYYQAAINFQGQKHKMLHTDGKSFRGNEPLQRQEAVYMIGKAFGLNDYSIPLTFTDSDQFAEWPKDVIRSMVYFGYVKGNPDGTFAPTAGITRAETVTILCNMVDMHIDEPGSYEKLDGKKILVTSPDVTISNSPAITVFISPGVGNGKVFIDEATADHRSSSAFYIIGASKDALEATGFKSPFCIFTAIIDPSSNSEKGSITFAGGSGTENDPYQINNENQLSLLGEYEYPQKHNSIYVILTDDIALTEPWKPIYRFAGQLDGCGHTIKNIIIKSQPFTDFAFISILMDGATIKNLKVQAEISIGERDNLDAIGGITGDSYGLISNCQAEINVNSGTHNVIVGGITGYVSDGGVVENCSTSGTITSTSAIISNEKHQGFYIDNTIEHNGLTVGMVGGIAGHVRSGGMIKRCDSQAKISVSVVEYIGYPRAEVCVGGVCGYLLGAIEESSFYQPGSVSVVISGFSGGCLPQTSAGGIAGRLGLQGQIVSCSSAAAVTASGSQHISSGGLVGSIKSTNLDKPTVTRSYATGQAIAADATNQNSAGGLIGHMEGGFVTECWSGGSAVTSGNPIWLNATGGFIGACYEEGTGIMYGGYEKYETTREKNIIRNCYTIASASSSGGTSVVGGFVGRVFGTFDNCYCAGTSNANSFIGATGISAGDATFRECGDFLNNSRGYPLFASLTNSIEKTTTVTYGELTKQNTYTTRKWDFNSVWMMPAFGSYKLPILRNADQNAQMNNPQPAHIR